MLTQLSIKNFAVVKQLSLDLNSGLTAITGETGAGKSIAIDAIALCLGERADASSVRKGAAKAEIVAHFSIDKNTAAKHWLEENALTADDDTNCCFIRRVVSAEGRSKAFINGTTCSLSQLRSLGELLLALYGQHSHLEILKDRRQRELLDNYADHNNLLDQVSEAYMHWQSLEQTLTTLNEQRQQRQDRQQLLAYQVNELDEFSLAQDEFKQLESEYKLMSNSQHILSQSQSCVFTLYEAENNATLATLRQCTDTLSELLEHDPSLNSVVTMLNESSIHLEEAVQELRHYTDNLETDPAHLQQVEQRYSHTIELARKHQVMPENLYERHQQLSDELAQINTSNSRLEELEQEVTQAKDRYLAATKKLHTSRSKAAGKLANALMGYVQQMNMAETKLKINVDYMPQLAASRTGLDTISILASTNKGQAFEKLEKVVSGGELSRIGLAVQVVSRHTSPVPTMIFDEVDTGISGPTASVVGQLLRKLGLEQQVICVTHLPQVAAQGNQQLFVSKINSKTETTTQVMALTAQDRVNELARLLAGDRITDSAIANAKALLEQADDATI